MTFQELLDAKFVEHHKCGACGSSVGYLIHPEMAVAVFNSGCDCSGRDNYYRPLTRKELADIPTPERDDEELISAMNGAMIAEDGSYIGNSDDMARAALQALRNYYGETNGTKKD